MSENEKQPPTPSKQTSSVPLKKETVRVTLKAADAPAVPSATVPAAPPVRPPAPTAPPAPTPPPAPTAAPRPAPAPTIPLRTAGAPAGAAPAPTIRLATSTSPIGAPGAPTKPLGTATKPLGATPTLPKATVQLQAPTASATAVSPSQAPTLYSEEEEEEGANEGVVNILAGVGLAAALVVLVFQLMLANTWISAEDSPEPGAWSQLFE